MKNYSIMGRAPLATMVAAAFTLTAALNVEAQETVRITVDASAVPIFVAADRDLFGDQKVEVSQVGYEQVQALLIAGETEIGWVSPVETISFIAEGSDLKFFSTAASLNMYNGVVVRSEEAEQYKTITDLEGKRLGIPGYGTGTWATFVAFMNAYYDIEAADEYFEIVTASSGALLALVERGEVDGALLFSGSSAAARSLPQFATIFSFTEAMQENTGQPLVITGSVATTEWLTENGQAAANVVAGLDAAVKWISENPSAFQKGGEYAHLAEAAGWLSEPETTSTVLGLIGEGKWYLTSDAYTAEWMNAVRDLVIAGGTLDTVPTIEDIFLAPDALPSAQ